MSFSKGLKFKKFDLHVHTPASKDDYRQKGIKPEDIVNSAISKGLIGIAITDHQTGEWIDPVKDAAKDKNLVVYPGVELKVNGGQNGIHLIILFDVNKGTKEVTQFLNRLEVYESGGKQPTIADKTVSQVAKALWEFDESALIILAHCLSGRGVISDMNGEQREAVFKPQLKNLLGAEAPESNFKDVKKIKDHDRVIDLLDGGFDDFYKKRMGVYQSSDAHTLDEIGAKLSYFKVDEPITIEDIRQCLIDRDARIKQASEYKIERYPFIESLSVKGGFLDGQRFEFHEGLNSILGAKGTAKSLAIELLRFAMAQQPTIPEILQDHDSKLAKRLLRYGEVAVIYSDESSKRYQIKRTYNPTEGNPTEIKDLTDNAVKDFEISQIFPVLFLSQNEIIKIAEDKKSQREFIDKFFDFYKYQQEIEKYKNELSLIDQRFSDILKAKLHEIALTKKLQTNKEEIEKINRQIKNSVFDEYSKREKVGQKLKQYLDFLHIIKDNLTVTQTEYKDYDIGKPPTEADPAVKRVDEITRTGLIEVNSKITDAISIVSGKIIAAEKEYQAWNTSFKPIKERYDKVVKEAGGNQIILDDRRKVLTNAISLIQADLTKFQGKASQIKIIADLRNKGVQNLEDAYTAYYEERKKRCEFFTSGSLGSLNVTIKEREDKTNFKENLMRFKKGSWLKDEEIEIITQKIDPKSFIDNILRFEWSQKKELKYLEAVSGKTGLDLARVESLARHLLDDYSYEQLLSLLYTSIPNDIPSIKYKVGNNFQDLDELSVGQKSVALLLIALSDGVLPIIIDQPEDSLDLRSIWDDLCKKLRNSKEKRQFIFTTHNSSVAVASDTDKFTILKANASHAEVLFTGSLNRKEVKKEVIDYLEGGIKTYGRKRLKYNT